MEFKHSDLRNMTVDEFTSVDPIVVSPGDSALKVLDLMTKYNIRHIPVTKDGVGIGIVVQRDLNRFSNSEVAELTAEDIMINDPFTVRHTDLLRDVVFNMSEQKFGSALVNDQNGKLMGIFTSIDALNAIIEIL